MIQKLNIRVGFIRSIQYMLTLFWLCSPTITGLVLILTSSMENFLGTYIRIETIGQIIYDQPLQ